MEIRAAHLDPAYRTALTACAALNTLMLFIEGSVGWQIGSAALLADAVDFLEDAVVFGLGIIATKWSARTRAFAGIAQSLAMAAVGFGSVAQIVQRLLHGGAPPAPLIGLIGLLALMVNVYCAWRLVRFRVGDSSMRAIWLSSRNDAILNMITIAAAACIAVTGSGWPDILAGAIIAVINLWAAFDVFREGVGELNNRE